MQKTHYNVILLADSKNNLCSSQSLFCLLFYIFSVLLFYNLFCFRLFKINALIVETKLLLYIFLNSLIQIFNKKLMLCMFDQTIFLSKFLYFTKINT